MCVKLQPPLLPYHPILPVQTSHPISHISSLLILPSSKPPLAAFSPCQISFSPQDQKFTSFIFSSPGRLLQTPSSTLNSPDKWFRVASLSCLSSLFIYSHKSKTAFLITKAGLQMCKLKRKFLNTIRVFTICLKSLLFLTLFLFPFSSQSCRKQADGCYKTKVKRDTPSWSMPVPPLSLQFRARGQLHLEKTAQAR